VVLKDVFDDIHPVANLSTQLVVVTGIDGLTQTPLVTEYPLTLNSKERKGKEEEENCNSKS